MNEQTLKIQYGPVYNLLFKTPPKSQQELQNRKKTLVRFLVANPNLAFRTGNPKTISAFNQAFEKFKNRIYNNKGITQKYYQAKRQYKARKEGIMAKGVISKIMEDLSFLDLVSLNNAELREMDSLDFWKKKLEELNNEDETDYQGRLKIQDPRVTVLTVMGIKELISDRKTKMMQLSTLARMVSYTYEQGELALNSRNYKKSPLLLEKVLPYLIHLRILALSQIKFEQFTKDTLSGGSKLTELTIVGKKSTKSLPIGLFRNLKNLYRLSISNVQFGKLPKNLFRGLDNLKILHLKGNQLTGIERGAFTGLGKLSGLTIGFGIPEKPLPRGIFKDLQQLDTIIIAHIPGAGVFEGMYFKELNIISPNVFEGLNNLREIWLENTKLENSPKEIVIGPNTLVRDNITTMRENSSRYYAIQKN